MQPEIKNYFYWVLEQNKAFPWRDFYLENIHIDHKHLENSLKVFIENSLNLSLFHFPFINWLCCLCWIFARVLLNP